MLHQVLVVEPVVEDTKSLVLSLNSGVNHLNSALEAIGRRPPDYSTAKAELEAAGSEGKISDSHFSDLGKGKRKELFTKLYAAASHNRGIQQRLVEQAERMVTYARDNNLEAYNDSMSKFDELSISYNQTGAAISALLTQK